MKVGIGYDVHRLVTGRELILGGVTIPYEKGLMGHSDADVLVHAVMDALLGAAGKGDIGRHFPDTDSAYKDISSMILLQRVGKLLHKCGYNIVNIDGIIIAEKPKLVTFIECMQQNILNALHISEGSVNIKATTTEGLGSIGAGEGIAAQAVALLAPV